jgi:histidinol-phosphatase (PHP family)
MEDHVISAVEQGMEEIGFLAHAEAGIEHPRDPRVLWLENGDYQAYWEEGQRLKAQYCNRIRISLGLELGLNPPALQELEAIILKYPWDRIGLSYHQLVDEDRHLNICSRRHIPRIREVDNLEFVKKYYRDLRDHVSRIRPYMLCHLDVVRKHMQDCSADPEVRRLIRELLVEMRNEGVLLEVNTAGYDTVGAPYPAPWIVCEALALGVGLVLNSDSHAPEQVGRHFAAAVRYIEHSLESGLTNFGLAPLGCEAIP